MSQTTPAMPAADTRPPVRLLVVDDIEQNILVMQALLEQPGIEIVSATSGAQALELLLEHDVALALLDVQMPEMDGFALAELMRGAERTRHVPIIFVTAAAHDRQRSFRGYEAGAVDFIYKPIDPPMLLSKVSVFVDLYRQRVQLAAQRDEMERMLKLNEMMSAVMSHDLRSPLAAIALSAEVVRMRGKADEGIQQAVGRIRASTQRMTHMIDQLLDFSRIRCGVLRLMPRPADLVRLCNTVAAEQPAAEVRVRTEGRTVGTFDPDRLQQVLANLIGNAVQHGDAGEPIDVLLDGSDEAWLRIEVANAGVLPATSLRNQLFAPFRGDGARDTGGLGLGLYIVRQFVEAHGGSVAARCDDAARRTTFEVRIPRATEAAPQGGGA